MTEGRPLLLVRQLRGPVIAVDRLSLAPGGMIAVMGPSGSGKSQLLRAIADLDPTEGSVLLDGTARDDFTAPGWRRRVMYVAPEPAWWAETVAEHFRLPDGEWPPDGERALKDDWSPSGARRAEADESDSDTAAVLARDLNLPNDVFRWPVGRLSSGEGQRLALMRAILRRPRILLLDEPTAALDTAAASAVEAALRSFLAAGGGIIMATHDPAQADRFGAKVIRLDRGLIAGSDKADAP